MARCEHLPIWRCAMDLALHMEAAVAGFPRVHRYALGAHPARPVPFYAQRGTGRAFCL
ncbi:MAG: hypothetical protein KIS84_05810 [Dokdonella sp.]|nr:hypothetical protein [Dokdonella sp.]